MFRDTFRADYLEEDGLFHILVKVISDANIAYSQRGKITHYSQQDNHIIEIHDIQMKKGCPYFSTKYYEDYYPLVFIRECMWPYDTKTFRECGARYRDFVKDQGRVEELYRSIAKEMRAFTDATGLYFEDISGNNILVNKDFTDYKIIDVGSITVAPADYKIDPVQVLLSQKLAVGNYGDPYLEEYVGDYKELMERFRKIECY